MKNEKRLLTTFSVFFIKKICETSVGVLDAYYDFYKQKIFVSAFFSPKKVKDIGARRDGAKHALKKTTKRTLMTA